MADHQRNLTDCKDGMASCDPSRLTQSEARESSVAAHQRNLANCTDGISDCDHSNLVRRKREAWTLPRGAECLRLQGWGGGLRSFQAYGFGNS